MLEVGTMHGRTGGMAAFSLVWVGQLVSTVGSGLTTFALGLWVLHESGSVTAYALIGVCAIVPRLAASPLAGVVVDRWDRRLVMLVADLGGLAVSTALVALIASGRLVVLDVYLAAAASGVLAAFQWPAWSAATAQLVPERHLGRAAGLASVAQAASDVFAPLLAGLLVVAVGAGPILALDAASFGVAALMLVLVRFPSVHGRAAATRAAGDGIGIGIGWRYIAGRPELRVLLAFLATANLAGGFLGALLAPMVLGFASAEQLGLVIAVAGAGMLAGSLAMAATGGPRRRVQGVVVGQLAAGAAFAAMGLRPEIALLGVAAFAAHVADVVVYGSNQAIWQARVPLEIQGRVFAARQVIERTATPLAYLLAGPLVEGVFDPLVNRAGVGASVVGAGPGRGIALLFVVLGAGQVLLAAWASRRRSLRLLDEPALRSPQAGQGDLDARLDGS